MRSLHGNFREAMYATAVLLFVGGGIWWRVDGFHPIPGLVIGCAAVVSALIIALYERGRGRER